MLEGFEKNDQYEYRALIGGETRSTVQTSNSYTESCFGWCGGGGGEKRSGRQFVLRVLKRQMAEAQHYCTSTLGEEK